MEKEVYEFMTWVLEISVRGKALGPRDGEIGPTSVTVGVPASLALSITNCDFLSR